MSFTYRHRKEILLITIVTILLSIGGIYFYNTNFKEKKKKKTSQNILIEKSSTTKKNEEKKITSTYKVDIKGAVNNPGIYSFNNQERIIDQTTPNMIQRISGIFERKPLISKEI